MGEKELRAILESHLRWLKNEDGGVRADLQGADLQRAELQGAELRGANLQGADLQGADLREADLRWANLRGADLSGANLSGANLRGADLSGADLSGANLRGADLSGANLSGAKNLLRASEWMKNNFEICADGFIVYKAIGNGTPKSYSVPESWKFEAESYLVEVCNPLPTLNCACGVNFGTIEWIKKNIKPPYGIWKCLIEWQDAPDIIVPYNTDGKARCGRLKLLEIV